MGSHKGAWAVGAAGAIIVLGHAVAGLAVIVGPAVVPGALAVIAALVAAAVLVVHVSRRRGTDRHDRRSDRSSRPK